MIIFANGQIDLPKQTVNFSNDIKVLDLFINEGQNICFGDTLFSYKILGDVIDQARIAGSSNNDWATRDKLNLIKNIEINNIQIQQKKKESFLPAPVA